VGKRSNQWPRVPAGDGIADRDIYVARCAGFGIEAGILNPQAHARGYNITASARPFFSVPLGGLRRRAFVVFLSAIVV